MSVVLLIFFCLLFVFFVLFFEIGSHLRGQAGFEALCRQMGMILGGSDDITQSSVHTR